MAESKTISFRGRQIPAADYELVPLGADNSITKKLVLRPKTSEAWSRARSLDNSYDRMEAYREILRNAVGQERAQFMVNWMAQWHSDTPVRWSENFVRDSDEDYALRILSTDEHLKKVIAVGNVEAAKRHGVRLGELLMEHRMKRAHEPDAIRGALSPISGSQGAAVTNAARKVEKEQRYAQIIEVRSDIQSRKPQLTQSALDSATVAALNKKGVTVSIPTVKRARLSAK